VKYSAKAEGAMSIKVMDITGRVILIYGINLQQGDNTFSINARDLAAGNYFLQTDDGIKITTTKFIKQ
jgi:hypothetical protein